MRHSLDEGIVVKDKKLQETITLTCPNGHRLRGAATLVGKTVKCPRCRAVFAITAPAPFTVTDTGVMRILGEVPSAPEPALNFGEVETEPCPRCGVAIDSGATVCKHCECYIGVMPRFMTNMLSRGQAS